MVMTATIEQEIKEGVEKIRQGIENGWDSQRPKVSGESIKSFVEGLRKKKVPPEQISLIENEVSQIVVGKAKRLFLLAIASPVAKNHVANAKHLLSLVDKTWQDLGLLPETIQRLRQNGVV
ncbi:MAG: hypothetical protein V1705_02035 [bacterium]